MHISMAVGAFEQYSIEDTHFFNQNRSAQSFVSQERRYEVSQWHLCCMFRGGSGIAIS